VTRSPSLNRRKSVMFASSSAAFARAASRSNAAITSSSILGASFWRLSLNGERFSLRMSVIHRCRCCSPYTKGVCLSGADRPQSHLVRIVRCECVGCCAASYSESIVASSLGAVGRPSSSAARRRRPSRSAVVACRRRDNRSVRSADRALTRSRLPKPQWSLLMHFGRLRCGAVAFCRNPFDRRSGLGRIITEKGAHRSWTSTPGRSRKSSTTGRCSFGAQA
jgi:hypothetical protein